MVISVVKNENGMLAPNPNAEIRQNSLSERKTLFAGDLTKKTNSVSQIREQARKKAQKIIDDVFDAEKELDEQVREMREKCSALIDRRAEDSISLQRIREEQKQLMEDNGIAEDSAEYQELELLRREREAQKDPMHPLSDEEKAQLADIYDRGLTKFQSDMLEKDEAAETYEDRVSSAEAGIAQISSSLRDIQIERLKEHPMVDAQKTAESIAAAANSEIIGLLRKEGMENVKEKLDEVVEKAKEAEEKKEEQEERLEESREKKEETEETDRDMQEVIEAYHGKKSKADEELEQMIDNLETIMEDIKGAEIDINL